MTESSTPRSSTSGTAGAVGAGLGTAIRVLRGGSSANLTRGFLAGAGGFLKATAHVLHLLWLEVTGFVFLCFGIIGSFAVMREYPKFQAGQLSQGRFVVTLLFAVMFLWFGVSSFWRARRKRK